MSEQQITNNEQVNYYMHLHTTYEHIYELMTKHERIYSVTRHMAYCYTSKHISYIIAYIDNNTHSIG